MIEFTRGRVAAAGVVLAALTLMLFGVAAAVPTGAVTVTVNPAVISIALTNPAFEFDAIDVSETKITPTDSTSNLQPSVDVDGSSDVVDLLISYDNATEAAGCDWEANAASVASDVFVMKALLQAPGTNALVALPIFGGGSADVLDATFNTGTGNVSLNFQFLTPSTITTGNTACTIAITVTAS